MTIVSMRTSEDRSGSLGNPCQSTGTSSLVSTGDLPVQVTNGPDLSSEVLIGWEGAQSVGVKG